MKTEIIITGRDNSRLNISIPGGKYIDLNEGIGIEEKLVKKVLKGLGFSRIYDREGDGVDIKLREKIVDKKDVKYNGMVARRDSQYAMLRSGKLWFTTRDGLYVEVEPSDH